MLFSCSYNCFNPKAAPVPHLLCPSGSSKQLLTCLSWKAIRKKKENSPAQTPHRKQAKRDPPAAFPSLTCFSPEAAAVSSLPSPGSALNQQQEQPLPTRPRTEFRIPLSPTLHLVTSLTHKEGALRDVINACWERKQNPGLGAWQRQHKSVLSPCRPLLPSPLQFSKGKSIRDFFLSFFFFLSPKSPDAEPICRKGAAAFSRLGC